VRAKARTLHVELHSTTLANRSIKEYLLRIRILVDNLASIGDPLPLSQHIDIILAGLPSEFNSVISVVESRFESMDMDELEAPLLAHENRLEKSKKNTIDDAASINIVQISHPNSSIPEQPSEYQPLADNSYDVDTPKYGADHSRYGPYSGTARGGGGRNIRGRGRSGGGRPNLNNNTQCQICFKPNHTALECWHRHQPHFQPQNPSSFHGPQQAPPPGYFQETHGPYS
jgi:hypothetical protein